MQFPPERHCPAGQVPAVAGAASKKNRASTDTKPGACRPPPRRLLDGTKSTSVPRASERMTRGASAGATIQVCRNDDPARQVHSYPIVAGRARVKHASVATSTGCPCRRRRSRHGLQPSPRRAAQRRGPQIVLSPTKKARHVEVEVGSQLVHATTAATQPPSTNAAGIIIIKNAAALPPQVRTLPDLDVVLPEYAHPAVHTHAAVPAAK